MEAAVTRISEIGQRPKPFVAEADTAELFNHVKSEGPMWTGNGPRDVEVVVKLKNTFAEPPVVSVGICGLDSSKAQNQRFNLSVKDITRREFTIVFHTWGDSRIARATANWTAFGNRA